MPLPLLMRKGVIQVGVAIGAITEGRTGIMIPAITGAAEIMRELTGTTITVVTEILTVTDHLLCSGEVILLTLVPVIMVYLAEAFQYHLEVIHTFILAALFIVRLVDITVLFTPQ